MLAPGRRCLGYSEVYYDVNRSLLWCHHIPQTNSKISIGRLYIRPHFVLWHRLNHCVTLDQIFSISLPTLSCWLVLHGIVENVEKYPRFPVAVWKKKKRHLEVLRIFWNRTVTVRSLYGSAPEFPNINLV